GGWHGNHPLVAALDDYTSIGGQVVLLTSDQELADQIARTGGRTFHLHAQRVVHPHRPLWRPHYQSEQYVGPHPHEPHQVDHRAEAGPASRRQVFDINRDFDMAWREAYGLYDSPDSSVAPVRTDLAPAGTSHRDGYYHTNTYTTVNHQSPGQLDAEGYRATGRTNGELRLQQANPEPNTKLESTHAASPFFLSVDSPIDQAPSVDAVAAARLRGLSVTHINHFMQQDSNRLADALGLASVNAATIRRWQAECRLVCRVPQLRGFDARVLVGCGVTDPRQLAQMHPVDLLQEVEAFLATERGQQILRSGSSQELSRITSWIAAANSSPEERAAAEARNSERHPGIFTFDGDHRGHQTTANGLTQPSRSVSARHKRRRPGPSATTSRQASPSRPGRSTRKSNSSRSTSRPRHQRGR
ncbi:MAG: DUF4332 domain-containing protein, partial [Pirellulales bacterium]|nr:DUF4332 domain-containing protein [Pirellulales bacterium]